MLNDFDDRKRVEDQKQELERIERVMFATIRTLPRDNSYTVEKSKGKEDVNKIERRDAVIELKEIFVKLRSAAGATKTEDVCKQFLRQRITKERLQNMRSVIEHEKICLERRRQQLSAEVGMKKFSETENTDQ